MIDSTAHILRNEKFYSLQFSFLILCFSICIRMKSFENSARSLRLLCGKRSSCARRAVFGFRDFRQEEDLYGVNVARRSPFHCGPTDLQVRVESTLWTTSCGHHSKKPTWHLDCSLSIDLVVRMDSFETLAPNLGVQSHRFLVLWCSSLPRASVASEQ